MPNNPSFAGDNDPQYAMGKVVTYCVDKSVIEPQQIQIDIQQNRQNGKTVVNEHSEPVSTPSTPVKDRDKWGNDIEFLFSCIALSVGLGNVWRFPFTALENGGGAFLFPYLIVLLLIGKPVYYMEMLLGQFSSRGSIQVFDLSPAMRGIGYGQTMATGFATTYYASIMALTVRYFLASFKDPLPWSECSSEWKEKCVSSVERTNIYQDGFSNLNQTTTAQSSAELYFLKIILRETDGISDGIGVPNWDLALCLIFAWICVTAILIKGVRSSGKASYFLAIFPYIIMAILLVRSCTLTGAWDGIKYFITPKWGKIFEAKVWYAAVTQVFFSLAIFFGNIIMYASYNRFSHNIYRDVTIVTALDTMTSVLAGCIIFGILGHLAWVTGAKDISTVVQGGAGLAFVSYPDAIAKFEFVPQLFSILFFLMLFVLGIGSNIGMAGCIITVIRDKFPLIKSWKVALGVGVCGCTIGLVYVTPGGQYVLNLVDFYGASFVAFVLAIAELITVGWIYGVNRLCKDVEFMLGIKTGLYWRLCWGVITPAMMASIMIYTFISLEPITYKGYTYPQSAYVIGWCITAFLLLQLPIWMVYAVWRQPEGTLSERICNAFRPTPGWGPADPALHAKYKNYLAENQPADMFTKPSILDKIKSNLFD